MYKQKKISVIIPALNEEKSIQKVINSLLELKNTTQQTLIDHIIVCDNGSRDSTQSIAKQAGAQVVYEPISGYGRACLKAIDALPTTDIILFIDADHAFYAHQAKPLIQAIDQGFDLAIGSRTLGNIEPGSLTLPQQFGNKLASQLIHLIWQFEVSDLGPYRAISQKALTQLNMKYKSFGLTIEMQIKAIQKNLKIIELPVDTRCRIGISKISGTIRGSIGAGIGILSMIAKLWWQAHQTQFKHENKTAIQPAKQHDFRNSL